MSARKEGRKRKKKKKRKKREMRRRVSKLKNRGIEKMDK